MLLIGSAAAKYHIPSFRQPNDYDIILNNAELEKFYGLNEDRIAEIRPQFYKNRYTCEIIIGGEITKIELHISKDNDSHELLSKAQKHDNTVRLFGCDILVASLHTLLAIKKTHIVFPIKW